ncbi:hypothetical protein ACKFKG_22195 [Phormidesmis sp. 146-35]
MITILLFLDDGGQCELKTVGLKSLEKILSDLQADRFRVGLVGWQG